MKRWLCWTLLLILSLFLTGCVQGSAKEESYPPAPDFSLLSIGGEELRLADYQGKLVLLAFWSSWCTYCQEELPLLGKIQEQYGDQLQVVAINLTYQDDRRAVKRFIEEQQLAYPVGLDRFGEVSKAYGVVGLPTLYVISPQGALLTQLPGLLSEETLIQEIETWL